MAPLSIQSGLNYPRCYKVCTHSRRRRRSLVASTLPELLEQAARVFMLSCCNLLTLVLEEDGTVVDSEELHPHHRVSQKVSDGSSLRSRPPPTHFLADMTLNLFREPKKKAIAKLTFDLYKVHPKDFLCCLAVRATLYEVYTLSYDFRCTRVKQVLRWVQLRRTSGSVWILVGPASPPEDPD
uniref:Cell death inducing DFFA like effector a n=1 Tax=Cyprinodon variegatus TaxID=28743 RepID=A0A3Q2G060_CYPVA